MVPHRVGMRGISPREAFLGRKLDYDRDIRCGFGDYLEVTVPNTDNTLQARTQPAIALVGTGNLTGSVHVFLLETKRIVVRDQFKVMPMTQLVITKMNQLSLSSQSVVMDQMGAPVNPDFDYGVEPAIPLDRLTVMSADQTDADQLHINDITQSTVSVDQDNVPLGNGLTPQANPQELFNNIVNDDQVFEDIVDYQPSYWSNYSIDQQIANQDSVEGAINIDNTTAASSLGTDNPNPSLYNLRSRHTSSRDVWNEMEQRFIRGNVLFSNGIGHDMLEYIYVTRISVNQALNKHPDEAVSSILKEAKAMVDKGVFTPVDNPLNNDVKGETIRSFVFLKEKFKPGGEFDKLKSRLVAGGHMQNRSCLSDEDISAKTVSTVFVFLLFAIAAHQKQYVRTADIANAFLNGDMSKYNIYMLIDPIFASALMKYDPCFREYRRSDGCVMVRLNKALYGCVQSAKVWYDLLVKTLVDFGCVQHPIDSCVFTWEVGGAKLFTCIYVDDIYYASESLILMNQFEELLRRSFQDITVHDGTVQDYLGMRWDLSNPGKVIISMPMYIDNILQQHAVSNKIVTSPATPNLLDISECELVDKNVKQDFHTVVAKLLYLAKRTRPDILMPVSFLTTRVNEPTVHDVGKVQRILQYLRGSKDKSLTLEIGNDFSVRQYIDASYGTHQSRHSHTGTAVFVGKGCILAQSTKQKIMTKSPSEAELVGLSDKAGLGIWVRNFLRHLGFEVKLFVHQDNEAAQHLIARGNSGSDLTRHIDIRYFWIHDYMGRDEFNLVNTRTNDMIADGLSKPLQGEQFVKFVHDVLNMNHTQGVR